MTGTGQEENMIELESLSPYLQKIIMECMSSDNEMWFVEYDDKEINELIISNPYMLSELEYEVWNFGLDDVIRFGEDDCYITVYGGVEEYIRDTITL